MTNARVATLKEAAAALSESAVGIVHGVFKGISVSQRLYRELKSNRSPQKAESACRPTRTLPTKGHSGRLDRLYGTCSIPFPASRGKWHWARMAGKMNKGRGRRGLAPDVKLIEVSYKSALASINGRPDAPYNHACILGRIVS